LTVGLLAGLVAVVLLDAVAVRLGLASGLLPHAAGAWPWLLSRAAGVTAFAALFLDVALGLALSTRAADGWVARGVSVELHRWLSSSALALLALHAGLLTADHVVRFDVLDALVPGVSAWRPLAVSLGVLAAWAVVVVQLSFSWRARLGPKAWRALHALSFPAFALAALHTVTAGTDAATWWLRGLVLGSAGVVGGLVAVRLGRPGATGSPAATGS
jgi:predicted ferric reductase